LGVSKSWTEEMAGRLTRIIVDAGDIRVVTRNSQLVFGADSYPWSLVSR
jgi:hypothetical protein